MTILRSPSGSWVDVRDGHKVRIYLRWGWTVFTDEEAWALISKTLETAIHEGRDTMRQFAKSMNVVGERGPELFIPDKPASVIPISVGDTE